MDRSSKRGKIPQRDWPSIIKRYEAGETLASIARTYGCSPPAISYIVSRSRKRDTAAERAAASSEPWLTMAQTNELQTPEGSQGERSPGGTGADIVQVESPRPVEDGGGSQDVRQSRMPNETAEASEPQTDPAVREREGPKEHAQGQHDVKDGGNGAFSRSVGLASIPPQNDEPRRTLHLSLPHEGARRPNTQYQDVPGASTSGSGERFAARPAGGQQQEFNGGPIRVMTEPNRTREGAAFIDQALRDRVEGDITAFLAAFDAALADDTAENRAELRDATDRLLRAGARTRIELERLEARAPLPARDNSGQPTAGRLR